MTPTEDLQSQIAAHRRANAARRVRAFAAGPDRVTGLYFRPLTLKTWTLLHCIESRFVVGGVPLEGDIRNYLWIHSPLFTEIRWLVRPLRWLALLPFSAILHLERDVDHYCAVIALAASDIRGIIAEAFADAPRGSRRDGSPAQGCLEAQLLHLFVKEYGWTPAYIRSRPLAQLIQLARQFGRDEDDPEEQAIKFAHLRRRNEELRAAREASPDLRHSPSDLPPS